jgi:UDP-N-acetylglucosamine 4,6-dehydratase
MRSVLITGGTGYLGRGLTAELLRRGTERICIFSRDEAKQAAMRASIQDPAGTLHWFIGDVRDRHRLERAMHGVNVVIHAAALKRVETGEYNPTEMVKTNVLGTMNVIEAATDAGVEKVLALSSDKACQPRNAYGASKLMLEKLVLGANNARGSHGPRFAVTRYGNVAGSTGSVIPTWRKALREGGLVVVSHSEATRYWMTLQEAVNLVLGLVETMHGGEHKIPRLPAYRLGDLAEAMGINCYNNPTGWHVGLGPGEKLHEKMEEDGLDSSQVARLSVDELQTALETI